MVGVCLSGMYETRAASTGTGEPQGEGEMRDVNHCRVGGWGSGQGSGERVK